MSTILKKRAQWCAIAAFAVVTITACPDHTSPPIYLTITKVVTSGAVSVTMGYGSSFYHGNP